MRDDKQLFFRVSRIPYLGSRILLILGIWVLGYLGTCVDARAATTPIPESDIAGLRAEMDRAAGQDMSIASRRDFKNTARKGLAVVEAAPDSPNRFRVLEIVFQCQKHLLALENIEQNRTALFETCGKLVKAPDEYAEARLEADLLLSDKELSDKNATMAERAQALAGMIERYSGTPAEAKSLLMAALIVQKLEAPDLEDSILYTLDERYSDDPEVIEFRRKYLKVSRLDLSFSGKHTRIDGKVIRFPMDTMGHMSLMVFWSKNKPGVDEYLENTKKQLAFFPGLVDVFSFNVDELPDGGKSILRGHGLDWTVMQLPEGRHHQAYRTYAQGDPVAVLVNEYSYSVIRPEVVNGLNAALDPMRIPQSSPLNPSRISEDRYMAQLQYLFIGDFLIAEDGLAKQPAPNSQQPAPKAGDVITAATLQPIQECFVSPPLRYRLTRDESLANYRKAAELCKDLLKQSADDPDSWRIRNMRIIALIGMWNLACEPDYLEEAVVEARSVLSGKFPAGSDIVPRFCLAKSEMRTGEADAEGVVIRFFNETGADNASAPALAAAAVLALDARSRDLHEKYRGLFLERYGDNQNLYAFASFLRDRHHRYRLLKPNYSSHERGVRSYIVNHGMEPMTNRFQRIELAGLDGSRLVLPKDNNDKLTLLLFVEPPPDPKADFPVILDRNGKPTNNDNIRQVMGDALMLAGQHVNKGVDVVVAFLCDDANRVRSLMATNGWSCQAAMVSGGIANPMVQQLGILSADRVPNVFLIRRDGTVAWTGSGFVYKAEFGFPFAYLLGMKVHIEACELETGYRALEKGNYEEAARIFPGPYPPFEPDRFGWRPPGYHGKALALMGMKDWNGALEAIDNSIDAHKLLHFRGRRTRAENWKTDAESFIMKEPCDIIHTLWKTRVIILDKLKRNEEAESLRKLCSKPATPDYPSIYSVFHERLDTLRKEIK